jgi:hypothetical protein
MTSHLIKFHEDSNFRIIMTLEYNIELYEREMKELL